MCTCVTYVYIRVKYSIIIHSSEMSGYFGMVPRNLTFNAVRENSEVVMKFTQNICWLVVDQPL